MRGEHIYLYTLGLVTVETPQEALPRSLPFRRYRYTLISCHRSQAYGTLLGALAPSLCCYASHRNMKSNRIAMLND